MSLQLPPAHASRFVRSITLRAVACAIAVLAAQAAAGASRAAEADLRPAVSAAGAYAVVVSQATWDDDAWRAVAEALLEKHDGKAIVYKQHVSEALEELKERHPRYVCFVATPKEAGRQFVADVHRMTRKFDDDPYTDCFWGILTNYTPEAALAVAQRREPLIVERVASGTEVALDACREGIWYSELKQHQMMRKTGDGAPQAEEGPADTTKALAETLTDYRAQLFVTSGHATERDWQIGYSYRNGRFICKAGQLKGVDVAGKEFDITADSPRVYLPVGNCLMGHVDSPEAMALAFMHTGGVQQMAGYTVPTWYGYAGWGCLDYFVEQPGRHTLTEAVFANQHALVHRLATGFPELADAEPPVGRILRPLPEPSEAGKAIGLKQQDGAGLLFDRDVLAFYGDPAWIARMADGPNGWKQELTQADGVVTLEITPLDGEQSFRQVNNNGSQRGGRPIICFLPERVRDVELLEGEELGAVVTDDFILVPRPAKAQEGKSYRVRFRAAAIE